jgi:hypothetical protein
MLTNEHFLQKIDYVQYFIRKNMVKSNEKNVKKRYRIKVVR